MATLGESPSPAIMGGGSTVRNESYGTEISDLDALPGGKKARVGNPEKTTEGENSHLEMLPPELRKSSAPCGIPNSAQS
jgi:hypothetical protein